MPTTECEDKAVRDPKFCELDQAGQIEKLRYELRIALQAISNIGNRVIAIQSHQHNSNGDVLISLNRIDRVFQSDRSRFLD